MATASVPVTPIERLLQIDTIHAEPAALELGRGRAVLARFPDAEVVEVASHWQIPGLHGNAGNVADWNAIKRTQLVLGTLKSPRLRPNGRSSDFIAPSQSNGCAMSCAYCYVPRRKGFANPITLFANIDQILRATERHIARQGRKPAPNHPRAEQVLWTPATQEPKRSQTGGWNVRYRRGWKGARVRELRALIERRAPWLRVRYAF